MEEEVLGFERKYAQEQREKRKQGFSNKIIHYHTFNILASKLVPVVSVEQLKEFRLRKLNEMLNRNEKRGYGNGYLNAIDEIIEEVKKKNE